MKKKTLMVAIGVTVADSTVAQEQTLVPVALGWANNSVNAVVFRQNSIVTHGTTQFIAYYNPDGVMVLGKREVGSTQWELHNTQYTGNVSDAHNCISIMTDGDGYLHVSWDHHGHPLRYACSVEPMSLILGDMEPMTGILENDVTYPQFFKLASGDLIFMYRDGMSGRGNLAMNHYDLKTRKWTQVQSNLIDGQNERNTYWQACVDDSGVIHVSWVWRETWDVETNHDFCYARSRDNGVTWEKSTGEKYNLPINATNAEYAFYIPQNSELINQTSMVADRLGNSYIATYWRDQDSDVPQYRIVYNTNNEWKSVNLGFRTLPFSLSGGGTKAIPIARPQLVVIEEDGNFTAVMMFRDKERGSKVSAAISYDIEGNKWDIVDLTDFTVNEWEPTYDTELWRNEGKLHIFVQDVIQVDGEGTGDEEPTLVQVLEVSDNLLYPQLP